uniref:Uncharacterized protein n=1 Tax=viral metagenome TaxID=1070528 RepID=A0A6C0JYI5_9ZZZZ
MQLILFIILWVLSVYSYQKFRPFSIQTFNKNGRRMLLELKNKNITLNITFKDPNITLPKIYLDDVNQIILLFQ